LGGLVDMMIRDCRVSIVFKASPRRRLVVA
jgi:hypothetical protein